MCTKLLFILRVHPANDWAKYCPNLPGESWRERINPSEIDAVVCQRLTSQWMFR